MALAEQTAAGPRPRGSRSLADREALETELRQLVRDAAVSSTIEEAVEVVLEKLDDMPHLNALFRQDAAQALVYEARSYLRSKMARQSVWTMPDRVLTVNAERVAARNSLYDWPLPGSDTRLGDATVDDLAVAAEYHDGRAASEQARAGLYRQIGAALKKSRKRVVREGLPESALDEIMRGAQ